MHTFIELTLAFLVLFSTGYIVREKLKYIERTRRMKIRLTDDVREKYGLNPVYTDAKGNRWFAFDNASRMPATRGIYVEIATRQAEMNMTDIVLLSFLTKLEEQMNKGKFVDSAATVAEMKGRMSWACEEVTLLNLASYYFIIEGEPVSTIVDSWIEKKKKLFQEDAELKAFFLLASFKTIKELSNLSESDILGYLAEKSVRKSIRQMKVSTNKS